MVGAMVRVVNTVIIVILRNRNVGCNLTLDWIHHKILKLISYIKLDLLLHKDNERRPVLASQMYSWFFPEIVCKITTR